MLGICNPASRMRNILGRIWFGPRFPDTNQARTLATASIALYEKSSTRYFDFNFEAQKNGETSKLG